MSQVHVQSVIYSAADGEITLKMTYNRSEEESGKMSKAYVNLFKDIIQQLMIGVDHVHEMDCCKAATYTKADIPIGATLYEKDSNNLLTVFLGEGDFDIALSRGLTQHREAYRRLLPLQKIGVQSSQKRAVKTEEIIEPKPEPELDLSALMDDLEIECQHLDRIFDEHLYNKEQLEMDDFLL